MNAVLKYALLFTFLWIVIKISAFLAHVQHGQWEVPILLINPLLLLLAMALGLRETKRKEKQGSATSFLGDVKTAMKAGVMYSLLVGLFTFTYYNYIDTDYFDQRENELIETMKKEKKKRKELRNKGEEVPPEEIDIEEAKKTFAMMSSPFGVMTMTLLAMITLSIFYAFFVTVLDRKFLSKI